MMIDDVTRRGFLTQWPLPRLDLVLPRGAGAQQSVMTSHVYKKVEGSRSRATCTMPIRGSTSPR